MRLLNRHIQRVVYILILCTIWFILSAGGCSDKDKEARKDQNTECPELTISQKADESEKTETSTGEQPGGSELLADLGKDPLMVGIISQQKTRGLKDTIQLDRTQEKLEESRKKQQEIEALIDQLVAGNSDLQAQWEQLKRQERSLEGNIIAYWQLVAEYDHVKERLEVSRALQGAYADVKEGRLIAALPTALSAVVWFNVYGYADRESLGLALVATIYRGIGRYDLALLYDRRVWKLIETQQEKTKQALEKIVCLSRMGDDYVGMEMFDQAISCYQEGLDIAKQRDIEEWSHLLSGAIQEATAKKSPNSDLLLLAAAQGNTATVKALLVKGADVDAKDKNDRTALMFAASKSHAKIVEMLLAKGADVNRKDKNAATALMFAGEGGATNIVQRLVDSGADVNAKNKDGWTALMFAARHKGYAKIVEMLVVNGADVNARAKDDKTALIIAAWKGNVKIVETLLASGADVNAKKNDGWTALMFAAGKGDAKIVEALLVNGADVNAKNADGWTALMFAELGRYSEIIPLLKRSSGKE